MVSDGGGEGNVERRSADAKADPYPLVVELPCHPTHWFDLACIQPWLQLQTTCPLDRLSVLPKPAPVPVEDSEEEYDEYYA